MTSGLDRTQLFFRGVHVGDGAIIGLSSVVGHDVEPYTIVAGNPAKPIRKRFDNETIELLLRLQWWNKDLHEIQQLIPLLTNSNMEYVKRTLKKIIQSGVQ